MKEKDDLDRQILDLLINHLPSHEEGNAEIAKNNEYLKLVYTHPVEKFMANDEYK